MAPTKQLEDLTRKDFLKNPYWIFDSANKGESYQNTTLVPQNHPEYAEGHARLIYTHYTFQNNMILDGFLYESPSNLFRHTIFYKYTGFETWFGVFSPDRGFIEQIYHLLQLSGRDIFPISWESYGKEYSGVINGFGYLENGIKKEIL